MRRNALNLAILLITANAAPSTAQPGLGAGPNAGLLNAISNTSANALANPNNVLSGSLLNADVLSTDQGNGLLDLDALNNDASLVGLEIADQTVVNLIDGKGALGATRPLKDSLNGLNKNLKATALGLAGPKGAVTQVVKSVGKGTKQTVQAVTGAVNSPALQSTTTSLGSALNVSVGAIDIGSNDASTLVDVDVMNSDSGREGAIGVGVLADDDSGNGSMIGAGVLGGDNAGNGSLVGAGVLNGKNSGRSDVVGAALISEDNSGSGAVAGATVLSTSSGSNNDFIDADLVTADSGRETGDADSSASDSAINNQGLRNAFGRDSQLIQTVDFLQTGAERVAAQVTGLLPIGGNATASVESVNLSVGRLDIGRNNDTTLLDIDVLNEDRGDKGQVGIGVLSRGAAGSGSRAGIAVGGDDNSGQGDIAGIAVKGGNNSGKGGALGIAAVAGANAGQGNGLALGLLNKDNSGKGNGLALGAGSGKNSGKGKALGLGLLNQDSDLALDTGSGNAPPAPLGGDGGVNGIGEAIGGAMQSLLGNDGLATAALEQDVAGGLRTGIGAATEGLAGAGLNDQTQPGDAINLSVGTLDIGQNSDETVLDIDLLAAQTGGNSAVGVGLLSEGNTGNGSVVGVSAVGGDNSGNGGIAGVSLIGDNASGNGGVLGAAVIGGQDNGNSGTVGLAVLTEERSGQGGLLGTALISGSDSGRGQGIGAAIIAGGNAGSGDTAGVGALSGDASGTSGQGVGAGLLAGNNSGDAGVLGVDVLTEDQVLDLSNNGASNFGLAADTLPLSGSDLASRGDSLTDTLGESLQSTAGGGSEGDSDGNSPLVEFLQIGVVDSLQNGTAAITDGLADNGLGDQPGAGELANLSVGSFDFGSNADDTLLDVDVLNSDTGDQGSVGLAVASDGASGNGSIAGVSVLGGDGSGNGGLAGASVIGGNSSGNADNGAGLAVIGNDNNGNGALAGVGVLTGANSATGGVSGVGAASGNGSATGGIAGVGVLSGDSSGQGGAVGGSVAGGDNSGAGNAAGAGIVGGEQSGTGGLVGAGILSGDNSGTGNSVGVGALAGNNAGTGNVAGIDVLTADQVVGITTPEDSDIASAINDAVQAVLGDNGAVTQSLEGPVADSLQSTVAALTDTLADAGLGDTEATGEMLNLSVGTLDIGANSENTLVDVDLLNSDSGDQGATGVGIVSDGASGTGDIAGVSVLGGDSSGTGEALGGSIAGGDNSGTSTEGAGVAIIGGDNAGNGDVAGIGVLTGDNSGNANAIGAGIVTGDNSASGDATGIAIISGDNSGQGGSLGTALIAGDNSGTGDSAGLAIVSGDDSGQGESLGAGVLTGDNSGTANDGAGIAIGSGDNSGAGVAGIAIASDAGSGAGAIVGGSLLGTADGADSLLGLGGNALTSDNTRLAIGGAQSGNGSGSDATASDLPDDVSRNPGFFNQPSANSFALNGDCDEGNCNSEVDCLDFNNAGSKQCELDFGQTLVLRGVNFEFGTATFVEGAQDYLQQALRIMQRNPDLVVEISGHTDGKGDDVANQRLSQQRAKAVKAYLVSQGIDAKRLKTAGYGSARPIARETRDGKDAPDARQQNRRVEFTILSGGKTRISQSTADIKS